MKISLTSKNVSACVQCPDDTVVFPTEDAHTATSPATTADAFLMPLELPRLAQCVVPGDRVCIVVDPDTPEVVRIISEVRQQFLDTVSSELDITLLLPADPSGKDWSWLTSSLPEGFAASTAICIHDPADDQQAGYLASTAAGERVYLNPLVIDADLIVTIGTMTWDSIIGIRGTTSGIYPALSNAETISASRKLSHIELNPADRHPRRELIDEIGWLVGIQFSVQVIAGCVGTIEQLLCGAPETVLKEGRQRLISSRQLQHHIDADLVILSIAAVNDQVTWKHLGHAVAVASKLVDDDTRIAVVADLPDSSGPAWQMLQRCDEPTDLVKPLTLEPIEDAPETIQLIQALRLSTIFLLSQLPTELVEDLGMLPLENTNELQRLIDNADQVAILKGGNFLAAT